MNGKQLRNSVLQLAISGKLVPQYPNDEPASELLRRINPKATTLPPDDAPFPIPDSWVWCKLENIGNIITGSTPSKSIKEYYNGDIPFFKPTDLEQGINVCEAGDHISELGYKKSRQLPPNSILVTCIGATIGKTGLTSVAGTCNQQINAIVPHNDVLPLYVYFACVSGYMQAKIKISASATTLPILNKGNFAKLLIPLPPLAEQERIVRKLEELFACIERYDKAQQALCDLNNGLKGKLRASILREAISGRLVPQDPNDEPASELLKRINPKAEPPKEEDIPFDIPDNWCWCRLGDIVAVRGGKRIPAGEKLTTDDTGHKYIRVTDMKNNTIVNNDIHYINDEIYQKIKAYTISKDDLYITVAGTIGSVGEVPVEFDGANLTENADKLTFSFLSKSFLLYSLLSGFVQSQVKRALTQVGQPKLAIKRIQDFTIPLPPLAEQKRIVAKIEAVFAVLDGLR